MIRPATAATMFLTGQSAVCGSLRLRLDGQQFLGKSASCLLSQRLPGHNITF
ncbi:hypothetical protein NDI52_29895 [Leptolyngbya sp. PL-A3]|uniref:hypothetical protein n=1 Tax=Leptolyngbya sp. PL-A3 TaxID=2933911 RepID=UPI0032976E72